MKSKPPAKPKPTNFDRYLQEHLRDPAFAAHFEEAGEAWDIALQITRLRESAGLSQAELARQLQTSQQQISRLESPAYEGHSLSMLRRLATALHARVKVVLEPLPESTSRLSQSAIVQETPATYKAKLTRPANPKVSSRAKT
jgi:transcriptional regulator with XRE-family HTH domain